MHGLVTDAGDACGCALETRLRLRAGGAAGDACIDGSCLLDGHGMLALTGAAGWLEKAGAASEMLRWCALVAWLLG